MTEILRNILRRKVRTFLTVFGIVIGVFALTVMGALSEYFNVMIEQAVRLSGGSIGVELKESGYRSVFSEGTLRRLERVEGVKAVIPEVWDTLGEVRSVQMGTPEMVFGVPPEQSQLAMEPIALRKGRWLERGDDYQAVIGDSIARKRGLDVGDTVTWKEKPFTVVGIMERTETSPDQIVIVPIDTARRLLKQPGAIHMVTVVPEDPSQGDALAERINQEVSEVKAIPPTQAVQDAAQALLVFNAIMLSGALVAVIVGGMAVINTMVMSVSERTREIGIKKAVGAEDSDILAEYVLEAALIGLIGGIMGVVLGGGMAQVLNATVAGALGGEGIFKVTPRLVFAALAFALVLGMGAGLYPAWRAARLDPVQALRNE